MIRPPSDRLQPDKNIKEVPLRFPRTNRSLLLIPAMLLASATAFASGFAIFEQGAKATAMGGAFAATADDPSAIFYNVAGLAQQRKTTVLVGGTVISFANEFRGDPNDAFTSGTTGNYRRHIFVPPNGYISIPLGTNMTFGVGMFSAFGLRTNWQDPWVGRFVSRDANIKTVSVEPALAWQTSDGRLAFGAGAEYRRARVILNRNSPLPGSGVNPFTGRIVDVSNAYLASDWDNAWGYSVGVLYKPGTWRIGASYRAPMTIDFKGNVKITQIPTGSPAVDAQVAAGLPPSQAVTTSLPFPASAAVGIATTMIPNWDIEADITRTTWSRFKALTVNFVQTPAFGFSRPQNWKDTYSYRLGTNHPVTSSWDVRLGALYDKNPQPTEVVSALLPDSDRIGVTFGIGYHRGPWMLDATEFVLHFKERGTMGISSDGFNGTYKTDANLITLDFGYRF
jgi:long-chain fatty acid transport protein